MFNLNQIHLSETGLQNVPLDDLGDSDGLNRRSIQTYERFYGLKSVTRSSDSLVEMLEPVLRDAVAGIAEAARCSGQLIYCKTQTHNTLADRNWLRDLADRNGLGGWDVHALSLTSCASALVQMHFAAKAGQEDPMIILTGEKAFHPWVSRLPVGLLSEIPSAAVFNAGCGSWRIVASHVRHLPRFHMNADVMTAEDRRALQEVYADELIGFVRDGLMDCGDMIDPGMVFVPHNLNLPMTQAVIRHFGWEDRVFHGDLSHIGHAYCSDPFVNLHSFECSGRTGTQVLLLAAGTGVTFASCLLNFRPET